MADEKISLNELSGPAHYALAYTRAIVAGKGSAAWREFEKGDKTVSLPGLDKRKALAKGLAELRERGVIECRRDGEGDLVPTILHEERLVPAEGRVIASDFN